METRRLEVLVELARRGSMRAVADVQGTSTSSVSQQIAALAREVGAPLLVPDGRRVRLTPAGRRLAGHAVTVLAALDAARRDLDPAAPPAGTVRVAGFASGIRALLPVVATLADTHPDVRIVVREYEPGEALALLADDEVDLALVYDYALAPAVWDPTLDLAPLWTTRWGLGVPAARAVPAGDAASVVRAVADDPWIGNSRNTADEQVLRLLASLAGVDARVTHEADSLDLVDDLIVAGLGVGLLPLDRRVAPGVRVLPLTAPEVEFRASTATRPGHAGWPPLALVLDRLHGASEWRHGHRTSATGLR